MDNLRHEMDKMSLNLPTECNSITIKNKFGSSIVIKVYKDEGKLQKLEFSSMDYPDTAQTLSRLDLFGEPELASHNIEIEVSKPPPEDSKKLQITIKRAITAYDLVTAGCVIEASAFAPKKVTNVKPTRLSPPPCCNNCRKDPLRLDELCCEVCITREASYDMVKTADTAEQNGSEPEPKPEQASQK